MFSTHVLPTKPSIMTKHSFEEAEGKHDFEQAEGLPKAFLIALAALAAKNAAAVKDGKPTSDLFVKPPGKLKVNWVTASPADGAFGRMYFDEPGDFDELRKLLLDLGKSPKEIEIWLGQIQGEYNLYDIKKLGPDYSDQVTYKPLEVDYSVETTGETVTTGATVTTGGKVTTGETVTTGGRADDDKYKNWDDTDIERKGHFIDAARERLRELADNRWMPEYRTELSQERIMKYHRKEVEKYAKSLQNIIGEYGFFYDAPSLIKITMLTEVTLDSLKINPEFLDLYQKNQPVEDIIETTVIRLSYGMDTTDSDNEIMKRVANIVYGVQGYSFLKQPVFLSEDDKALSEDDKANYPIVHRANYRAQTINTINRLIVSQMAQPFEGEPIKEMKTLAALYLAANSQEIIRMLVEQGPEATKAKASGVVKGPFVEDQKITEESKKLLWQFLRRDQHNAKNTVTMIRALDRELNGVIEMAERFRRFIDKTSQVFLDAYQYQETEKKAAIYNARKKAENAEKKAATHNAGKKAENAEKKAAFHRKRPNFKEIAENARKKAAFYRKWPEINAARKKAAKFKKIAENAEKKAAFYRKWPNFNKTTLHENVKIAAVDIAANIAAFAVSFGVGAWVAWVVGWAAVRAYHRYEDSHEQETLERFYRLLKERRGEKFLKEVDENDLQIGAEVSFVVGDKTLEGQVDGFIWDEEQWKLVLVEYGDDRVEYFSPIYKVLDERRRQELEEQERQERLNSEDSEDSDDTDTEYPHDYR